MTKTEYDCKLNAKIIFEPTPDHPDTSKLNVNQDKIFPVKDLNEANEKFAEFQESWQQYFHKIHKEYNLSGNIQFNRLCKTGNAPDQLSELVFPSRDHHHLKNDIMKATFKRLCQAKRQSPEYKNECQMKRLAAIKEGKKDARCNFHCFLGKNSKTEELEVYRIDVSIKNDHRR